MPQFPDRGSLVSRAQAFRGITNHRELEFCGDFQQRIHVDGMTEHMNRHDGGDPAPGILVTQFTADPMAAIGQKLGHLQDIHLPIVRLRINEDRPGVGITDRIGRGDKGQRGDQHFIVGLHAREQQCDVQRRSAVDRGDRKLGAGALRHHRLKAVHIRTHGRDPARIQAVFDISPLVALDLRDTKRNEGLAHETKCGRYHSKLFDSPSLRETCGAKPSNVRALVISGLRR